MELNIKKKEVVQRDTLYVRIPKESVAWLKKQAKDSGRSLSEFVAMMVEQYKK